MFFNRGIIFKQKTIDESAYDLCRRFYTSKNSYEIRTLRNLLQEDRPDFKLCKEFLEKETTENGVSYDLLDKFEEFWTDNSQSIIAELTKMLDCDSVIPSQLLCFFDVAPYNLIDFNNATISLSMNKSFEDNLSTFISFLIKYSVINRLWYGEVARVNMTYSKDSVYWIMADFVADAICYHSTLPCFKIMPAYKYYYSLYKDGEKLVDKFRRLYLEMPILDFIKYVLTYVEKNYSIFRNFTNRY